MGTTAAAGAIKPGRGRREAHAHGAGSAMSHGNGWGPRLVPASSGVKGEVLSLSAAAGPIRGYFPHGASFGVFASKSLLICVWNTQVVQCV